MRRFAMHTLEKWKNSASRKPLLVYGARQVGKTWLMKEFGRQYFKNVLYVNFETDRDTHKFFERNIDPSVIVPLLSAEYGEKIDPNGTLIIFDEIQECQRAKTSLKYFNENAPEYHVVAAGSLLGVASGSFPVGQVNFMTLHPLSYAEFLYAMGNDRMAEALTGKDWDILRALHDKYIDLLKYYFYVGGMPNAVLGFTNGNNDFEAARTAQHEILNAYQADFAKHISPVDVPKVREVWDVIPAQFAKDNHKFIYSAIRSSARGREYENAIRWLVDSGLVYRVNRVNLPPLSQLPLSAYAEHDHFKMYVVDVGLLSCKSDLKIETILDPDNTVFGHFKGSLTEQFVLQELVTIPEMKKPGSGYNIYYWGEWNKAEIDFVIQRGGGAVPVEVKANINLKAKSLQTYMAKYNPKTAIRTSQREYGQNGILYDIPLYAIGNLGEMTAEPQTRRRGEGAVPVGR